MAAVHTSPLRAQQGHSTYDDGDSLAALVRMNYIYNFEEALVQSRQTGKPIFFNCFADWARPCHAMNALVFSDQKFCEWMDKHFVCFFADVTEPDNRYLADRYDIRTFAQFLVLDADGQVVHRVVRGRKLPDFQESVALALSPKTSLKGTAEAYNKGDRSKRNLLNYLTALDLASSDSLFDEILPAYTELLNLKDYARPENWIFALKQVRKPDHPIFQYVVNNRSTFDKGVGQEQVNGLISGIYSRELFNFASGETKYDENQLLNIYLAMQKSALPDSNFCYPLYRIIKLWGHKQYEQMVDSLRALTDQNMRYILDMTFKFDEPTPAQQQHILAYYGEQEKYYGGAGSRLAEAYHDLAERLVPKTEQATGGIAFTTASFDELLAKAAKDQKLVFIDGYTTWCGPCKMLAAKTFPQTEVGDFMNPRFISAQIDMERGEGPELAHRYGISAYPTMLILRPDGTLVGKVVGYHEPQPFLDRIREILK